MDVQSGYEFIEIGGRVMRVFLAPRSNETSYRNFLSTIENGVEFQVVEPFLSEGGKRALAGQGKLFVWGNRESKKPSWERMEIDDLVLFYKGKQGDEKEGKFVYAGRLLYKEHSRELGLGLWPPKPGQEPWTCVFFLRDLQPVYVPVSDIAALGGYKKGFVVQGFMPLSEQGTRGIVERFGGAEGFVRHYAVGGKARVSDLEGTREVAVETTPAGEVREESLHKSLKRRLKEIGEILGRYAKEEHAASPYVYDVVWKETEGLPRPSHVFEVQDKGAVDSALAKLQHARDMWRPKLFLVVTGERDRKKVDMLLKPFLEGTFHGISRDTTVVMGGEVEEMHRALSGHREVMRQFLEI